LPIKWLEILWKLTDLLTNFFTFFRPDWPKTLDVPNWISFACNNRIYLIPWIALLESINWQQQQINTNNEIRVYKDHFVFLTWRQLATGKSTKYIPNISWPPTSISCILRTNTKSKNTVDHLILIFKRESEVRAVGHVWD